MAKRTSRLYMRLVYAILWGMVWTYPLLVETMKVVQDGNDFSWADVRHAWMGIVPFFCFTGCRCIDCCCGIGCGPTVFRRSACSHCLLPAATWAWKLRPGIALRRNGRCHPPTSSRRSPDRSAPATTSSPAAR